MITRSFDDLVRDLRLRRRVGDKPPALLLGAGASIDAGIGAMNDLFEFFGLADFDAFCAYIATTTAAERYRYLAEFLQTRKPAEVTPGYRALATLCAQNYFDLVLTTNMDPLLDDALAAAQLWRRDYLLIVNGVIRPDRLTLLLGGQSPRVKIVKLHGDLFQRFMAWTVEEMDAFLADILPQLGPALAGRDVLVVGHSLRDERIRELAQSTGGALWFTHPQQVPAHLAANVAMRAVVAPEVAFESFFPALASKLELEAAPAATAPPATRSRSIGGSAPRSTGARPVAPPAADAPRTLDDLLASVYCVLGPNDQPSSTAFLVADPRVIVCDAFAVGSLVGKDGVLRLLGADQRPFEARVLRTNTAHPFGPTLLAVPDAIRTPGLQVATAPSQPGDAVQIAVAAGTRTGVSAGHVAPTSAPTVRIDPIGEVADLAALEAVVRSGASGAPVVDASMAVRGMIVAGSADEARPESYMYPSDRWSAWIADRPSRLRSIRSGALRSRRPPRA